MIYLDMDGVLADFVQQLQILQIPNNHQWFEPRDTWTAETWAGEKIKTDAMHSSGFWNTVPVMSGGEELWDFCHHWVGQSGVSILTSAPQKDSPSVVAEDKFQWINEKLGPISVSRFHCVAPHTKQLYLKAGDILVDDDKRNAEGLDPGAYFIHHLATYTRDEKRGSVVMVEEPNVISTINKIKEIYS